MDKAENAMVTITKERYDFHIAEIERLREELRVSRQSTKILIKSLDEEIERLRENAKQDARYLSAYHRICQKHGIAPSSSDLIEAMKGDE
jgi:uncharacterized protein with von Willebrand factor type A (vWA) domain